ncbi:unnamed protein product, partial [Urochloa humidicola]
DIIYSAGIHQGNYYCRNAIFVDIQAGYENMKKMSSRVISVVTELSFNVRPHCDWFLRAQLGAFLLNT